MKPKRKSYRRKVTALVDATPAYLSVVDRGASGSPFTLVKKEDSPMKINARKGAAPKEAVQKSNKVVETPATRKKASEAAPKTETVITKFVLAKAQYETVDAAKAFIEESDFEGDVTFEETDDSIIVHNADVQDRTIVKQSEIETGEEGVTATVAHVVVKSEDDPEDDNDEDEDDEEEEIVQNAADGSGDEDTDPTDDEEEMTKGKGKKKPVMSEKTEEEEAEAAATETKADDETVENACGPDGKKKPVVAEDVAKAEEQTTLSKREQFLASLVKAEEPAVVVRKFDMYEVWTENNDTSFASLLKSGMSDGAAPGLSDVLWTFGECVRKSLRKGEGDVAAQLRQDAASMIDLVIAQNELFTNIIESSPEDMSKAESPRSYEDLQKWATAFGKSLLEDGKAATAETVAKSDQGTVNNTVIAQPDVDSMVNEKLAPVLETVQNLAKTVDKIASRKQVSKSVPTSDLSADEEANPQVKEKSTKQKAATSNLSAVVFGR